MTNIEESQAIAASGPIRIGRRRMMAVLLILLPVLQACNLALVDNEFARKFLSDLLQAASAGVAAVLSVGAARRLRREGSKSARGWSYIAAAMCLWVAGMILFMFIEIVLNAPPYPGIPDVLFVSFYPTMIVGLSFLPREPVSRRDYWNAVLDVSALGVVAFLVIWQFNLRLLLQSVAVAPNPGTWMSLLYTIVDTLLLLTLFSTLLHKLGRGRQFVPLLFLVIGSFFLITADMLQGYITTQTSFASGLPVDLGWVLFSTFSGLAALALMKFGEDRAVGDSTLARANGSRTIWTLAVSYLWIIVILLLLFWAVFHGRQTQPGLLIAGAMIAMVLAIARQLRTVRENIQLYAELQQNAALLDDKVRQRTAELQKQKEILAESEARFRTLVENAPEAIVVLDPEKRIFVDANANACRLYGLKIEELLGRDPVTLSPPFQPDGRPSEESAVEKIRQAIAGVSPRFEWLHRNTRGLDIPCEINLTLLPSSERLLLRASIVDATERRQLEAQLRQSQKLDAIGQLAGGVAHDFNNILAAIMLNLDLLQLNPRLDENTQNSLKDLETEVRRAATLTRQLLMFSRRSVLDVKPLGINDVVGNLIKMLNRLIGEQIELRFDGGAGLPLIEADAGMIEQVLMNLVVNARDAMPRGGKISIRTALSELRDSEVAANPDRRRGRFIQLSVSDTGSGMDEETMEHIFEPFFSTKAEGKGTGLGLATVDGIVAQHQGWVEVESRIGSGSTFRVFLPVQSRSAAIEQAAPAEPLRGGSETILLVEDKANVRHLIGQALRILGYTVHEAANGREAMELWQANGVRADLLLSDMVMPEGMTGLELAERLQGFAPGLAVIITSGYSAEIAQAGIHNRPGFMYLPKPYEIKTLAETVRQCLNQRNGALPPGSGF